jgi:hypothetical protein
LGHGTDPFVNSLGRLGLAALQFGYPPGDRIKLMLA